jgi:signal transduction histidine kinase
MAGMEILLAVLAAGLVGLAVYIGHRFPGGQVHKVVARILSYLGWGTLLVPLALMGMQLWGMNTWTQSVLLCAIPVAVLAPAVAADLAALLLVAGGIYGMLLGAFWPSIAWPTARTDLFYGTVIVRSEWTAALAGMEGLALAVFGLWLIPRTLARHALVAALIGRLPASLVHGMPIQALRGRLHRLGWGVLLLPVTLIGLPFYLHSQVAGAIVVTAVAVTTLLPAVAGRIMPFALAALGLFGMIIATSWPALVQGPYGYRMYGLAYLDSGPQVVLAGLQGLAFLGLAMWLAPRTIGWPGQVAALAGRVQRLAQTRTDAVDVAAAELRRVERDLHDGAQARLVALGMSLRAAERLIQSNPVAAQALVAEARDASSRALTDLRDLVRGIYPPVLADRGLGDAIRALALDAPVRTELDINLPGRPAAPVESAVYFAVAEVLANAVKHAGARSVLVRLAHSRGMLRAEVTDDGAGGADPASGTGLQGIERRLGTFDGVLAVSSPPGGPTIVVIEVPCELLSPRTYSC